MQATTDYIEFTWIIIKDAATGYYSAFFAEIPEAIAQGKTQKEAKKNLLHIVPFALQDRRDDAFRQYNGTGYKTKSLHIPVSA